MYLSILDVRDLVVCLARWFCLYIYCMISSFVGSACISGGAMKFLNCSATLKACSAVVKIRSFKLVGMEGSSES